MHKTLVSGCSSDALQNLPGEEWAKKEITYRYRAKNSGLWDTFHMVA